MGQHFAHGAGADDAAGATVGEAGGEAAVRKPRRGHAVLIAVLSVLVALAIALAAGGTSLVGSAQALVAEAQGLSTTVGQLETAVKAGDGEAMQACTDDMRTAVSSMRSELEGPLWGLASLVPVYGSDVTGAKSLLDIAGNLVDQVLTPLSDTMAACPPSSLMTGGAVNADALRRYSSLVTQIEPALDKAVRDLDALGTFNIDQLNDAVGKLSEPLHEASDTLAAYGPLLERLPEFLGCDGPRTYLLVAQCNSELRATGGFPGAWGTLTVDGGHVSLSEFVSMGKREVTFEITGEEQAIFGAEMGISACNLNDTPDFTRVGYLFSQAWLAYHDQQVDGVIAVDPVFLQRLMAATGSSVTTEDGTLVDGTNAARILSSDTYWRFGDDNASQDAFFGEVAAAAAGKVMENLGSADPMGLVDTIAANAREGRLLVWSPDAEVEQALGAVEGITGALGSDPLEPVVGLYLNDNTWAKMSWYLLMDTQVVGKTENPDGTVTYDMATTMTNSLTPEEAEVAPGYIAGSGPFKRSRDDMYNQVLLVAPAGGSISGAAVSNGTGEFVQSTLYGHEVWVGSVNLYAQESATVTYSVTVAPGAAELEYRQTPLAQG